MKVLLSLVAVCFCAATCVAIDCFTCSGTIGTPEGDACADGSNKTSATGFDFCFTSGNILSPDLDTKRVVTRSGGVNKPNGDIQEQECDTSLDVCYCTTQLCNMKAAVKSTTSCYVCQSVPLFDNGCGNDKLFNPDSIYVQKEKECSACTKTQTYDTIIRDCEYSIHAVDGCYTQIDKATDDYIIKCSCSDDDCNHASSLFCASTAYFLITLSLISKFLM